MMVDNAGAVVSVPVEDIFSAGVTMTAQQSSAASSTPSITNNSTTVVNNSETVGLEIDAETNYVPLVNGTRDNLINSVLYQSGNKIGFNNKSPKYLADVKGDSVNIEALKVADGYRIKSNLLLWLDTSLQKIFLGDVNKIKDVSLDTLYLSGLVESPAASYSKFLQVQPDGKVVPFVAPSANSIIFSNGTILTSDVTKFSWNTVSSIFTVIGTANVSAGITTSSIGEYASGGGVNAQNNWTFASNVTIPAVPTSPTHAASKEYVDNTALTGLKLGASVMTVAVSDIPLTGLSAVNGYTPSAGDRILVIGQTVQSQNGVYLANALAWTRATDSDSDAELRGFQYLITAGTNANYRYGNTNQSTITVGVTSITYQTISAGETDPIFTASPSFGITNTNISNWTTAYNRSPISLGFSGTSTKTLTLTKQDGSTLSANFSIASSDVTESGNLYFTDARARGAISAGAGISYNGSTGVISFSGNIYNDSSIRGLFSAGSGLSYNSSTGTFSSTITQYTDALARNSISAGSGISYNSSTGVISSTYSTPSLSSVCGVSADATGFSIIASSFFESSDVRYKNILGENPNIDVSSIDVIKYIRTTYDKDKIRYGYSAQQVFDILPELVNNDGISLSVNYTDLHTLKILQLEKRVAELEAKLGI